MLEVVSRSFREVVASATGSSVQCAPPSIHSNISASVYPSTLSFIYPLIHPSTHACIHRLIHLSTISSIFHSIHAVLLHPSIQPSALRLSVQASIYPFISPPLHPLLHPSIRPSTRPLFPRLLRLSLHSSACPSKCFSFNALWMLHTIWLNLLTDQVLPLRSTWRICFVLSHSTSNSIVFIG